ncbi:MAG: hypothetical protein SV375_10765, partial [Thermodesulfobacteriota bacterium]|nr:hypothetical protein [Thermodesulfobacteriota bacterium]
DEVLIYLPSRVRILLLSATISNAEEICLWLEENRNLKTSIVRSHERPVPLEMLFLFPDGLISPLAGKSGLTPKVQKFLSSRNSRWRRGSGKLDFGYILKCLREFDLLPAIFFLKSRIDCNRAIRSCPPVNKPLDVKDRLKRDVVEFLKEYPHLEEHPQLDSLLGAMVGSHHAGQLPYWKILIEKMMKNGHLEAIFSTSTVAAGVNFPARTVVLLQSDRFNGHEFTDLTATDLQQMIGRAGRRGKDNIGFALIIPGLHQNPQLLYELRDSRPEPLISQIHVNFSMTLNLLLSHTPDEVRDLLNRSFAAFQESRSEPYVQKEWEEMFNVLNRTLPRGKCDTNNPHEIIENIQKRAELKGEARKLVKEIQAFRRLNAYKEYLQPGRLFLHKNRDIYVVFNTYMDNEIFICAAHNIKKEIRTRKHQIRLKKVPLNKIKYLFDYRVHFMDDYSIKRLQIIFNQIELGDLEILKLDIPGNINEVADLEFAQNRLKELPCEDCEHFKECHTSKNKELKKLLDDFHLLSFQTAGIGSGLWPSFKRHVRFLRETGFVDEMDQLKPDGHWASKLRLDYPLLIAEAIRKGAMDGMSPEIMAGSIAPFVWDRVQEFDFKLQESLGLDVMEAAFNRILDCIEDIRKLKVKRGFKNPQILFWPGAALFLWAKGVPWERLLYLLPVDEGDMASLIMRTTDHLRQVTNLDETHSELVTVSKMAIDLILREPVFIL